MLHPEDENKNENISAEEPATAAPEPKKEVKPEPEEKAAKKKAKSETADAKAEKAKAEKPAKKEAKKSDKPGEKKDKAPKKGKKTDTAKESDKSSKKKKDKADKASVKMPDDYLPRQLIFYRETVTAELKKRFRYKNVNMIPKLEKIILNVGIGEGSQNPKLLESVTKELSAIAGQKAVVTHARKSISNFKLRQGMPVGCRVTLRGWRMWEFFDRMMNIAIPRIRDFRGLSDKSFDGRGNYTFGIKEHIIFTEIDIDKIERVHGMDITFVTTANTDEEAHALLQASGWPFRRRETQSTEQAA